MAPRKEPTKPAKKEPDPAAGSARSLGFLPLLIMTLIYLICYVLFPDPIGEMTSEPGMYQHCRMPQASP